MNITEKKYFSSPGSKEFQFANGKLFFAFFLSGMSGLIYQIVWVRMLTRFLGSTTSATATVLCVFMGGLAIGAFFGGKIADKNKNPLMGYVVIEIGITISALLASFALISTLGGVYINVFHFFEGKFIYIILSRIVFSIVCLLPPTVLMGATLPFLVSFITRTKLHYQTGLGRLYSINTFGAVTGVFIAGFFLLEFFGERSSLYIAVLFNLIAVLIVYRIQRRLLTSSYRMTNSSGVQLSNSILVPYSKRIQYFSRVAIFISGFTALAYEIMWTRMLMLPLQTSIYAFSFMLGIFLAGIAIGSWGSTKVKYSVNYPVAIFALLEIIIGFLTSIGLWVFWSFGNISDGFVHSQYIKLLTCFLMVFPTALAFGWQFPAAARCCVSDVDSPGKDSGGAYFANTSGAISGSILAGFCLIPLFGTVQSMKMLAILNVVIGTILFWLCSREERKRFTAVAVTFSIIFFITLLPIGDPYLDVMHKRAKQHLGSDAQIYGYYEGVAGTTIPAGSPDNALKRHLYTNGVGMTVLSSETKLMAHLPMVLTKTPNRILVVCFGMGTTLRSAFKHTKDPIQIDAVDIIPYVFDCFGFFHKDADYIAAQPNIRFIVNDGRNYLLTHQKPYDVITIDPAPPIYSAGTVNLYTREFLELCRSKITVDGVVCLWLPPAPMEELFMIMKTFVNVFPGASLWGGFNFPGLYLIGGHRSFGLNDKNLTEISHKLSKIEDLSEWEDFYKNENILKELYLMGPAGVKELVRYSLEVTDDHPYTEFPLWRSVFSDNRTHLTADLIRRYTKSQKTGKVRLSDGTRE